MIDLTVISVNEADNGTLDLMIRSVLKFTDFVPKFIICQNNGPKSINISKIYKDCEYIKVIQNTPLYLGGSNRHSSGLNAIFPLVDTKYTAIIESDCVVLNKDWYKLPSGKKMLAAKKVEDLYHICFLVFETDALHGIDFGPGTKDTRSNRSYKVHEDVGWKIKDFIAQDKIELLNFIDCKGPRAKIFNNFQSDEFHYKDQILAAHFGRGSNLSGKTIRSGFDSHKVQLENWKNIVGGLIDI